MKLNVDDSLVIELPRDEIYSLWDALMFSLDWQTSDLTVNEPKMSDETEKLVKELVHILEYFK